MAPVDTSRREILPPIVPRADTTAVTPREATGDALRTHLLAKQRELQLAYLHVAEFYAYSLTHQDSAITYFQLAASSPVNANVYWRANLYLATALTAPPDSVKPDSVKADSVKLDSLSGEAAEHFRAVVNADSVPDEAANVARSALKMPLIEVPELPQVVALRAAENAMLADTVAPDSVANLYTRVIAMDSSSEQGKMALYAKAVLLENRMHRSDQARTVYEDLLRLGPDSAVAVIARRKIASPDTNSIFNMTDEQLSGKHEAVESLLDQKQDKTGWPPTEESLRGRHF
jgi:hypothetical protein